mgnify:FL=1|tara:strand:- start:7891 stop:9177 length:1287 start_codon:yes stop_codon:yes gene_type:complete
MNIFETMKTYVNRNHYVDVDDKIPVFLCSVGTHIFNGLNKCGTCPFIPTGEEGAFAIDSCILRHDKAPLYTPMSHIADTRLHILMRGMKGSGKSVLINLFLAPGTGLLNNPLNADIGMAFRTDIGANSITEAGMFGSVNEEGEIMGRPLAREMCGGFLGFEEFSSLVDAGRKDHSIDMTNQLLTSTDNGRVRKAMRAGWVQYTTRFTLWAGTQPGRFEMESGMDRRFFIIDIDMNPKKEMQFKKAQAKQASMTNAERAELAGLAIEIKDFFTERAMEVIMNPPTGVRFDEALNEWLYKPEVRSHEADLFRRLALGYTIMSPDYEGGDLLYVKMTDQLRDILDSSLEMRRGVMESDINLIKTAFWNTELTRTALIKEVARMITPGDYQAAKRWVEDNLLIQAWYSEERSSASGRGRKGVKVFIGYKEDD